MCKTELCKLLFNIFSSINWNFQKCNTSDMSSSIYWLVLWRQTLFERDHQYSFQFLWFKYWFNQIFFHHMEPVKVTGTRRANDQLQICIQAWLTCIHLYYEINTVNKKKSWIKAAQQRLLQVSHFSEPLRQLGLMSVYLQLSKWYMYTFSYQVH